MCWFVLWFVSLWCVAVCSCVLCSVALSCVVVASRRVVLSVVLCWVCIVSSLCCVVMWCVAL